MVKSSLAVFLPNQPWNENHQRVEALPTFTGTFFPRVGPPVCKLRNIYVRSVGVEECTRVLNQISLKIEQPISKWLVVSSSWSECTGIVILYIVPAYGAPLSNGDHGAPTKSKTCTLYMYKLRSIYIRFIYEFILFLNSCMNWDQYTFYIWIYSIF